MKLRKKQISLGVLAAVTLVAIPVATVVSCGSDDKKIDTVPPFLDSPILSNYIEKRPVMQSIMTPQNGGTTMQYPSINLDGAKKNNAAVVKNWTKIAEYKIAWTQNGRDVRKNDKFNKNLEVSDKTEFNKAVKEINADLKKKIDSLSDLHKRTLVFANTEKKSEANKTTSSIQKGYFILSVYDTLKQGADLSSTLKGAINSLVTNSNIKATKWDDFSQLDAAIDSPKSVNGTANSKTDLIKRAMIRNSFEGVDEEILLPLNIFDADLGMGNTKADIVKPTKFLNYEKHISGLPKTFKVFQSTFSDYKNNALRESFTFFEGTETKEAARDKLDSSYPVEIENLPNDKFTTSFTLNPIILDFDHPYSEITNGVNSIFAQGNEDKLKELIQNQLLVILSGGGSEIPKFMDILRKLFPGLLGYINNSNKTIKRMVQTEVKYRSEIQAFRNSGDTKDPMAKKMFDALDATLSKSIPEIQKKFSQNNEYGKLLYSINELQTGADSKNIFEAQKGLAVFASKQSHNFEFREQYILFYAPKIISDFSEILFKNWKI